MVGAPGAGEDRRGDGDRGRRGRGGRAPRSRAGRAQRRRQVATNFPRTFLAPLSLGVPPWSLQLATLKPNAYPAHTWASLSASVSVGEACPRRSPQAFRGSPRPTLWSLCDLEQLRGLSASGCSGKSQSSLTSGVLGSSCDLMLLRYLAWDGARCPRSSLRAGEGDGGCNLDSEPLPSPHLQAASAPQGERGTKGRRRTAGTEMDRDGLHGGGFREQAYPGHEEGGQGTEPEQRGAPAQRGSPEPRTHLYPDLLLHFLPLLLPEGLRVETRIRVHAVIPILPQI